MTNTGFKDVFISYGRAESKAFATKLHDQLSSLGYNVWFDQNDIPLGVDFQHQIDEGIEKADNFIFIIAPHAVKSPYCRKEIELAVKRGKRIIPILQIEPQTKEVWDMLHPAIGKINWIYMRQEWKEGIPQSDYANLDDHDTAFKGLVTLLEEHKEYVRQHTQILSRAIEWERNYRHSTHLMVAQERKMAEEWLFQRFDDVQAPCHPSDLHCQYISEAKKNANNLQTDVFIASADGNIPLREQVVFMLARYGITSWTHVSDIETGDDFHVAIRKGIEGADNVIFLITKDSIVSEYCINELNYAIELNKRIIPLRLEKIEEEDFPEQIKNIQYIDFTDNEDNLLLSKNEKTDFEKDIDDILSILDTDDTYFSRHKVLLVQALKWQRQERSPSMLLRGHNLEQAKIWLKLGKKRSHLKPLPIHEDFIAESQAKSTSLRTDVFVSYSRTDGDFARQLNESLQIAGKTTWFDQESIASGADFQAEIYKGIENADNIVFVLSPESILSPYCADEVEYARQLGKRFVTLLYREVETSKLPPALAQVQWIDFRPERTDYDKQFSEVVRTLDTDRAHVRAHTKWQQRAMEWEQAGKTNDLLLRGNELVLAHDWRKKSNEENKIPAVTALQQEFVRASRKENKRRERNLEQNKQIAIATLAIILAVAVLAASQWYKSWNHQKELATQNLLFESRDLMDKNLSKSLRLAREAYHAEEKKTLPVIRNLYRQLEKKHPSNLYVELEAKDSIVSVIASEDNTKFLVLDSTGRLTLHNEEGKLLKTLDEQNSKFSAYYYYSGYENNTISTPPYIDISSDGERIAFRSSDGNIVLSDGSGNTIRTISIPEEAIPALGFYQMVDTATYLFVQEEMYMPYVGEDGKISSSLSIFDASSGNEVSDLPIQPSEDITVALQTVQDRIENKSVGSVAGRDNFFNADLYYYLGKTYSATQDDEDWLFFKNNAKKPKFTYRLGENTRLSTTKSEDFVIVYQDNRVSGFVFPDTLETLLTDVSPLSSEERIKYDTASIKDYRNVPIEAAKFLAQFLIFGVVFLLSILIFNYFNRLYLDNKYFKIVIYSFGGLAIALVWLGFLLNDNHVIRVAFFSAICLSVVGFYYAYLDFKRQLYFNASLYSFSALVLTIVSLSVAHYLGAAKGYGVALVELFGLINWLLVLFVGIVWITSEQASERFSLRQFRYFSDWIGLQIFTVGVFGFLGLASKIGTYDEISVQELFDASNFGVIAFFSFLLVMPLTYFIRTFIHQLVMYRYEKAPYSKSVLKVYAAIGILFFLTFVMLIISPDTVALYIIIAIIILFPLYYFYTLFVAYKQKDKLNLKANLIFWWGAFVLLFFSLLLIETNVTYSETILYILLGLTFWLLPVALVWKWRDRMKKKRLASPTT